MDNYKWVFFPVHVTNHWVLVAVQVQDRTIHVLDSIQNSRRRKCLLRACRWVHIQLLVQRSALSSNWLINHTICAPELSFVGPWPKSCWWPLVWISEASIFSSAVDIVSRVGVKYFSKYLSQVQVLFHICKYKFKYSEYLEDIKYIKYFFQSSTSQVQALW